MIRDVTFLMNDQRCRYPNEPIICLGHDDLKLMMYPELKNLVLSNTRFLITDSCLKDPHPDQSHSFAHSPLQTEDSCLIICFWNLNIDCCHPVPVVMQRSYFLGGLNVVVLAAAAAAAVVVALDRVLLAFVLA